MASMKSMGSHCSLSAVYPSDSLVDDCPGLESEVDSSPFHDIPTMDSKSDVEVEVRQTTWRTSSGFFDDKEVIEEKNTTLSASYDLKKKITCQALRMSIPASRTNDVQIALRVLIVDDAKSNRKLMSRLLSTRYLLCEEEACDGLCAIASIALAMHKNLLPEVIFMDFVMPNMDGPTATQIIRSLGYKGLIIGVTGNALLSDIELFLSHGANKIMTKPFNMDSFELFLSGEFQLHYNIYDRFVL